jgi:ABC-2 type transport system ATP-binding protein
VNDDRPTPEAAPAADPSLGPAARLTGVVRRFGDVVALDGIDLEVRRGEVHGLLGPNGAGKTTAVRILCGLLEPTEGRAWIADHDVQAEPLAARRRYAFVPDGAPLYAQLSPRQHLALVGRLHGLDEDAIAAGTARLLSGFELAHRVDAPVGGFSRGMRQKTAIACALLPDPDLLVLDEPLSGLDAPSTAILKELLRAWAAQGRAVLYTSHLLDVVERVCDRMTILADGRVLAVGSMAELRTAAGRDGTLEDLFRAVTHAEDPAERARAILGGR